MTIERTIKKVAYPQAVVKCEITVLRNADGEIIAAWDSVGAMLDAYDGEWLFTIAKEAR